MSNELKWHEGSLCVDGPTWLDSAVIGFASGLVCLFASGRGGRKGPAYQK